MRGLLALTIFGAVVSAQEPPSAPAQLIITYRCPPPRRAAFRQYMKEAGLQRFEHWKQDGVLTDFRFVFNWFVDVDTWDAMAVLTFPNYAAVARWKEIEKVTPAGLARDGLEIAWPLNTYAVDLLAHESADPPVDASHAVYFIVPYDFPTSAAFRDYANAVIAPMARATMREGVLAESNVYVNHYPGGKRWQGLLVLEYKDVDSFARRDVVLARVRGQLRADTNYRTAESNQKTNPERESVIAEPVQVP